MGNKDDPSTGALLPTVGGDVEHSTYAMRWWILLCFSLFTLTQSWAWALAGPISAAVEEVYNIEGSTIMLFLNYGPIFYLPASIPFALWLDAPGRISSSVRFSMFLVWAGAFARWVGTFESTMKTHWLALALNHIGYALNASAGPVAMSAVGKISSDWFPPHQRATATAIMSQANLFGSGLAQILGPQMVKHSGDYATKVAGLRDYQLVVLVLATVTLLFSIKFPARPPTAPSTSAQRQVESEDRFTIQLFCGALKTLVTDGRFLVLCLAYGISLGVYASWGASLSLALKPVGYGDKEAGWISFVSMVAGTVGGVVVGRVADRIAKGEYKKFLVILMFLASLSFLCFTAVAQKIVHLHPDTAFALLFVFGALGGLFLNCCVPLYYEGAMEITFPIPEGTVCSVLTDMNNVGALIFLTIPFEKFPNGLMNWLMTFSVFLCGMLLICGYTDGARRYKLDTLPEDEKVEVEEEISGTKYSKQHHSDNLN